MKKALILVTLLFVTLFSAKTASADCTPIYGGGQTCSAAGNLVIDKKVMTPGTTTKGGVVSGTFVDNLSSNDPKFNVGDSITFQITVTNTGDATLNTVTVTDTFPTYVSFVSGPGNFNTSSKQLTFVLTNLKSNESRTFTVIGKVNSNLPINQTVTCDVNHSSAVADNGQMSNDDSNFCITQNVTTKGGTPIFPAPKVSSTPPTGPEALPLLGLIPGGLAGLFLRKKTSK